MTRLQHLTLNALIDAAYWCGASGDKVNLFIVAPSRAGKTWAAKSMQEAPGVTYFNGSYSPTKYKEFIREHTKDTSLFIHDDTGRVESWNYKAFVAIWAMMADGMIDTKDFGQVIMVPCRFSFIMLSTVAQFHSWLQLYKASGLYDRFLPVALGLSSETREVYNQGVQVRAWEDDDAQASPNGREPPKRLPRPWKRTEALDLRGRVSDTTHMETLCALSRYLSPAEMEELVRVVRSPSPVYEI